MIRRMARTVLWGVVAKKHAILERLYELGVFHATPKEDPSNVFLERVRHLRTRVLHLLEALRWDGWKSLTEAFVENVRYNLAREPRQMLDEIERSLERIDFRLNRVRENMRGLEDDFQALRRANAILSYARTFLEREHLVRGEVAIWSLEREGCHRVVSRINGEIALLPRGHERPSFRHHVFELKEGTSFLVTSASPEIVNRLETEILENRGTRWTLPQAFTELPLLEAAAEIKRYLRGIPAQMREYRNELLNLSSQWGINLAAVYVLLNERLELLLMETATTENADYFSLEGWVPEDSLEHTLTILKEDFGDSVLMRWRSPDTSKDGVVPTALRNRPLFKPFELFLKLLRLPHYNAYDPSHMIGIFFPFFAGCMVGDVGYGILMLWLGWHLKQKKSELLHDIGIIILFISFWSIFWGLMYGEIFGDLGHRLLHMKPLWVDRAHAVPPVMFFSIALGGAHVVLGLLIGMIQGIKRKKHHLWMERAGSLLFIFALIGGLVVLRTGLPPKFFTAPVLLLVFALIFMIWGNGVGGIAESLGAVGNIISYVRIAAIGLSSAILAMVAGTFVDTFGVSVLGLFMALAIHLLNFVLALGGSSLHSARLHYVEFMGKFYETGTLEYKPFAKGVRGRYRSEEVFS